MVLFQYFSGETFSVDSRFTARDTTPELSEYKEIKQLFIILYYNIYVLKTDNFHLKHLCHNEYVGNVTKK
jgi:hypothetical protein